MSSILTLVISVVYGPCKNAVPDADFPRLVMGSVHVAIFAQFGQNLSRFHRVPPSVVTSTTHKKKTQKFIIQRIMKKNLFYLKKLYQNGLSRKLEIENFLFASLCDEKCHHFATIKKENQINKSKIFEFKTIVFNKTVSLDTLLK